MSRKLALFLALMLSGLSIGGLPQSANAQTPLTRAVIQALRNRVRLMQKNQPVRSARVTDAMTPGDALSTARASLAELRFNDGSLARVGEQAVFRFVPNARTFQLSNGTMLLLIPPGRGPTGIRTPNAAAGIKGSALFVRYIPETDTTLVGALTNNPQGPMVIYNRDGSQSQGLQAGQLAVVVKNRIENIYEFDLNTFYETSDLVKGLNLTQKESNSPSDEAIAAVRAETVEALQTQSPFKTANVIENPTFVRLSSDTTGFPDNNLDRIFNSVDVRRAIDPGAVQSGPTVASPQQTGSSSGSVPPVAGTTSPTAQPTGSVSESANPSQDQPSNKPAISLPSLPTATSPTPREPAPLGQKVAPDARLLTPRPTPVGSTPQASPSQTPTSIPNITPPITPAVPPTAQEPATPPATPAVPPTAQEPATPPVTPAVPPTAQEPATPPVTPAVPPAAQIPGDPTQIDEPPQPILIEPLPGGSVVPIDVTGPLPNPIPGSGDTPGGPTPAPGSGDTPGGPTPAPGSGDTPGTTQEPGDPTRGNGNGATPATGGTPPGQAIPPGQGGPRPNSDNVINNGSKN